jgi:hypothetical protein
MSSELAEQTCTLWFHTPNMSAGTPTIPTNAPPGSAARAADAKIHDSTVDVDLISLTRRFFETTR